MQSFESDGKLLHQGQKPFPQPLSLLWRIQHTVPYLIGGITFLIGSCQYLPSISNYDLGGWLFTIGSAGFLYADAVEWWTNNRVGCVCSGRYHDGYEELIGKHMAPEDTMRGRLQRAENGTNFLFSAFGSFLYLIGSILFIPEEHEIYVGTIVFIPGSIVILLSQIWKLYRQGCASIDNPQDKRFAFNNYLADLPAVGVDVCAGLGGLFYLVGSVFFLPQFASSDMSLVLAAVFFIVGGAMFFVSAIFIVYRYFFTLKYPH